MNPLGDYRDFFDLSAELIQCVNAEGRFEYVNPFWLDTLGYTSEEVRHLHCTDILRPDQVPSCRQAFASLLAGERLARLETVFLTKEGREVLVTGSCRPRANTAKQRILIGIFQDVTEIKRIEAALEKQAARLREQAQLLDLVPAVVRDLDNNIVLWTQGAEKLYGWSAAEALGNNADTLYQSRYPQPLEEIEAQVVRTGQWQGELTQRRRDGSTLTVVSQWVLYSNAQGQIASILEINNDITARKQLEEQLAQALAEMRALSGYLQTAREAERTRIAREIHDELGQALTAIKLDLSWLKNRLAKGADAATMAPLLHKSEDMTALVDSTIQCVRRLATDLRPGILDDMGLLAALEWQAQEFHHRTGIPCEVRTELEDIPLDRERATAVFRIFQETLTNVARHAEATAVTVRITTDANQLVLEVKDNGKGFDNQKLRQQHTLGMVGMRERAILAGGDLHIEGFPGKGTQVTARIPLGQ